ncbi:hypothetical protein UFOVP22_12 [uncultured Caudovirales phage]|uniref:Uncharacterized protein n=1 Tax=uncultured Caudovirales phage TaxID=2100421 RepID=A0A6J5T9I4_9CAUD|nr:hypothetical protein UFOVP22_12 [uncultured Caudovirales phage]
MADIVQGLFGVSPESLKAQQDAQFQQQQIQLAQLDPQQQRFVQMGAGGRALGQAVGGMFGAQDPALYKQAQENKLLQDVQAGMSPEDMADPVKLSTAVYQAALKANLPDLANHAYSNLQASTLQNAKVGVENSQIAKNTQDIATKQQEANKELMASAAIQKLYSSKQALGQTPTTEEIIAASAPYMSAEKLATMMNTSADKAAYRDTMIKQAEVANQARIEAAKERGATAKDLAQMQFGFAKQLAQIKSDLNPKASGSVYERGYANNFVTSSAELVPASNNLNILTQGGTSPITAGIFTGIKGTGILSSTSAALGTAITPAESGQYESIMLPVIQNIGTMQNAGRRTTIAQLDNLKNALIAKPGQPYIVQVQKMGELRQIAKAATEAAMANPSLSEEQKALVQGNQTKLEQSIPFTGADVAKYSIYAKKNPNIPFKAWLQVNGEDKAQLNPIPSNSTPNGTTKVIGKVTYIFDGKGWKAQ